MNNIKIAIQGKKNFMNSKNIIQGEPDEDR